MDLEISFDLQDWIEALKSLQRNLTAEYLLQDAPQILREDVAEQFLAGGEPAWAPLSEARLAIRARKNSANLAILIDTGGLLTSWVDSGSVGHFEHIDTDSLTFGTLLPKAAVLHGGGYNEDGAMVPARPINIKPDVLQSIASSVLTRLTENL